MKKSPLVAAALVAACAGLPGNPGSPVSLAEAEQAFAAQSLREDMRAAFLAHFASEGVMVRGGWVNARDWLEPRTAPAIVLEWRPVHVETARSGDLGLSTGPWRITPKGGTSPTAYGQFVSIWRRAGTGPWQVVVDLGIRHPGPDLWDASLDARASPGVPAGSPLAEAEAAFSARSRSDGIGAAWKAWAAADLRTYRDGGPPAIGASPTGGGMTGDTRLAWFAEDTATASSGELGYARGHYARASSPAQVAGYYLHVWRQEAGGWRLVLDVVNPAST